MLCTQDFEAAMLWHEQGITADQTFRMNHWALGYAMIWAKSTFEGEMLHIMESAEKHLWQYIKQGVPEDEYRCSAMYELVIVAIFSLTFSKHFHLFLLRYLVLLIPRKLRLRGIAWLLHA